MAQPRSLYSRLRLPARRSEAFALAALLVMTGLAIAGPSGLFAWSETLQLRDAREARLAKLEAERDRLKNRVELLDPANADPDLAGELVRRQMGVVHPDEVVVKLED
ncbi:FtsB family cell division protein [Qipengyuania sediminis]|uniref:FtsB family cell division protein n=1 Tax=Qipengyuania sediminis TaxID=1532023 RepID=UPI001059C457|nr:septum formation initiator family protein [Qipengyuania sediminis]